MWRLSITAVKYSLVQSQLYELLVTKTPIVCCPISIQMINKITEERHWGHSLTACNDALNITLPRSVFFSYVPKSGLFYVCIWKNDRSLWGLYFCQHRSFWKKQEHCMRCRTGVSAKCTTCKRPRLSRRTCLPLSWTDSRVVILLVFKSLEFVASTLWVCWSA